MSAAILSKYAQGLDASPGADSMALHGCHLGAQIMADLDGKNWGLADYVKR